VTVAIPVLNEARHLAETLRTVRAQTYPNLVETLVIDGGSTDSTVAIARSADSVRVLTNEQRVQAAALNLAIAEARGEIIVRVDGHSWIESDYVQRCVEALEETSAAMVGGPINPVGDGRAQRGIAAAMRSVLGAGPARFHGGRSAGWVDTVYLGAFRVEAARAAGGYDPTKSVNEDAEFAFRLGRHGGVWYDPSICSSYRPREDLRALARQFFAYGRGRADTVIEHPSSLQPRQLAAPLLVLGAISPWRRKVALVYGIAVATVAIRVTRDGVDALPTALLAFPTMHLAWGAGFWVGALDRLVARHGTTC